jgi:hypothetical protein
MPSDCASEKCFQIHAPYDTTQPQAEFQGLVPHMAWTGLSQVHRRLGKRRVRTRTRLTPTTSRPDIPVGLFSGPRRLVRFCLRGGLGDELVYGSVAPRSKKEKEVREGSVIMYIPDLREMTLPEITLWRLGWF